MKNKKTSDIKKQNKKRKPYKSLHTPVFEIENNAFIHIISSKWFSDDFYLLLKKHNFSIILKNADTGAMTFIRTFGVRFPILLSEIA